MRLESVKRIFYKKYHCQSGQLNGRDNIQTVSCTYKAGLKFKKKNINKAT